MKSKNGVNVNDKFLLRDMIFVTGLQKELLNESWLRSKSGLGQYGLVKKVIFNQDKLGVFVTFETEFQAAIAILGTDGVAIQEGYIRSSIGLARRCPREVQGRNCLIDFCTFFHQNGRRGKVPEIVKKLKDTKHIDILGFVLRHSNLSKFLISNHSIPDNNILRSVQSLKVLLS